jgi:hypothetical protein
LTSIPSSQYCLDDPIEWSDGVTRRLRQLLVAAALVGSTAIMQVPFAFAHSWSVQNECSWSDPGEYFYLAGPQSSWSFHTTGTECHVDGQLISGVTPTAWGNWYLPISSNYNHTYHVTAGIDCGDASAHRAAYVIYRMYIAGSSGGYYTEYRNQRSYCGNMSLDTYTFTATSGGYVRVVNTTGCPNCVGQIFQVDSMAWAQ